MRFAHVAGSARNAMSLLRGRAGAHRRTCAIGECAGRRRPAAGSVPNSDAVDKAGWLGESVAGARGHEPKRRGPALRPGVDSALHTRSDRLHKRLSDLRHGVYEELPTPAGTWAWRRGDHVVVAVNLGPPGRDRRRRRERSRSSRCAGREGEVVAGTAHLGPAEGAVSVRSPALSRVLLTAASPALGQPLRLRPRRQKSSGRQPRRRRCLPMSAGGLRRIPLRISISPTKCRIGIVAIVTSVAHDSCGSHSRRRGVSRR